MADFKKPIDWSYWWESDPIDRLLNDLDFKDSETLVPVRLRHADKELLNRYDLITVFDSDVPKKKKKNNAYDVYESMADHWDGLENKGLFEGQEKYNSQFGYDKYNLDKYYIVVDKAFWGTSSSFGALRLDDSNKVFTDRSGEPIITGYQPDGVNKPICAITMKLDYLCDPASEKPMSWLWYARYSSPEYNSHIDKKSKLSIDKVEYDIKDGLGFIRKTKDCATGKILRIEYYGIKKIPITGSTYDELSKRDMRQKDLRRNEIVALFKRDNGARYYPHAINGQAEYEDLSFRKEVLDFYRNKDKYNLTDSCLYNYVHYRQNKDGGSITTERKRLIDFLTWDGNGRHWADHQIEHDINNVSTQYTKPAHEGRFPDKDNADRLRDIIKAIHDIDENYIDKKYADPSYTNLDNDLVSNDKKHFFDKVHTLKEILCGAFIYGKEKPIDRLMRYYHYDDKPEVEPILLDIINTRNVPSHSNLDNKHDQADIDEYIDELRSKYGKDLEDIYSLFMGAMVKAFDALLNHLSALEKSS